MKTNNNHGTAPVSGAIGCVPAAETSTRGFTLHPLPEPEADDVAFAALLECFRLTGRFATPNSIRVFTHCPVEKLVAAGWLVEGKLGRWMQGYHAAGQLLTAIENLAPGTAPVSGASGCVPASRPNHHHHP